MVRRSLTLAPRLQAAGSCPNAVPTAAHPNTTTATTNATFVCQPSPEM